MVSNNSLIKSLQFEANKYKTSSDMYDCGVYDGLVSCIKWIEGTHDIDGILYEGKNMVYSSQKYKNDADNAKSEDEVLYFSGISYGFELGYGIVNNWLDHNGY